MHLLWGEDQFLLREASLQIFGPDVQPREVDAGDWEGGELTDLATLSLFGEQRALLVNDCRALPEHALHELGVYLASPVPDAPLVLCSLVPERGRPPASLVKLVEPVGRVVEVKLGRKDLAGWLVARARGRGVDLTGEGAATLVETLGEDPAALDQAIDQLSAAFPGQPLGQDAVRSQFRGLGEQHVWDLCDRAFGKDLPGAMRSLRTLMEAREDPLKILGGLASRLRDLLRVRSLPERMPAAEAAKAAGLRFDWQVRRYRAQASRFSVDDLVDLHGLITGADRALKSGASDEVVMPVLVGAIAGSSE